MRNFDLNDKIDNILAVFNPPCIPDYYFQSLIIPLSKLKGKTFVKTINIKQTLYIVPSDSIRCKWYLLQ